MSDINATDNLHNEILAAYRKWDIFSIDSGLVAFAAGYRAVHEAHESVYESDVPDASIGREPSLHKHDWIVHSQENGATFATCSFCLNCVQLR